MARYVLALSLLLVAACASCPKPPTESTVTTPPPPTVVEVAPPDAAPQEMEAHALESDAGFPPIKIATWNLEWLNEDNNTGNVKRKDADYERLKGYANRLNADVVAFQEVDGEKAATRVFDPNVYDIHVSQQGNVQSTGFAVKKGIVVTRNPDYEELDVGAVRTGTDITVKLGATPIRMMSVHLKSGCFDQPLNSTASCRKLGQQVPILEAWIDARAQEGVAAVVLGDFNRRFFKPGPADVVWAEVDDGDPTASDLSSPTDGQRPQCWNGEFADFIDHLVFNSLAIQHQAPDSFVQHVYDASDAQHKSVLSDHCALSVQLGVGGPGDPPADPPPSAACVIKGNINSSGVKLYHKPGCPSYATTVIDPENGERCFATEQEAVGAGWAKAGNCN